MSKKPRTTRRRAGSVPAVRVRMFRQGLGDCFLITFNPGTDERHMLIDCGTLGNKATGVTMTHVVDEIANSTSRHGKSTLDIVVATHAHQDHVSGFLSRRQVFESFRVHNVWMGWTEDPTDALAKKLAKTARAMRAAIADAHRLAPAAGDTRERLAGLAEFEGGVVGAAGDLAMGETIAQALDVLRDLPGARLTYHSPGGAPVELADIPGFRFYVLGPPRDEKKIASMGDHGSDELYGLTTALRAMGGGGGGSGDADQPFDVRFSYPMEDVERLYPEYRKDVHRRIDSTWMDAAASAAAVLDKFRNNTSLVIAIERIADGKVLLFPADAQEGNWLSWHDAANSFRVKDAGGKRTVTAEDLLERTVFYKVGHHASHNATAKGKGLEVMRRSKNLTAFIPVDREVALGKSPKGSWKMPAVALFRELLEACNGRVARADLGWVKDARVTGKPGIERELSGIATAEEWKQWGRAQKQAANVSEHPMYIEYLLE
ncbi:MAG TPA: hypothetical protein VHN77_01695 [Phycisphaerales bacterium]|nr:hypothetical protein [Phycisphaerales bacterium]